MIINVRGTSGSGKSTAVRKLVERYAPRGFANPMARPVYGETGRRPSGYCVIPDAELGALSDLYVVGSYENTCGGCDAIKTQDEICDRVRGWRGAGDVILEGLLMSHLYQRYADLAREQSDIPFIFAFLDTPLELCVERVKTRREARAQKMGKEATPLNETNTRQKWHDMRRCYAKFRNSGHDARWLDHTRPDEVLLGWLRGGS